MFKRGQTTVYITLGLLIIIIIGGLFYFMSKQSKSQQTISSLSQQSAQVKTMIQNCFEQNLLQALYLVGIQGGYIKLPDKSISINQDLSVAYGYYEGQDVLVDNNKLSLEVTNYLNFVLQKCADFSTFKDFNVQKKTDPRSRIDIFDDKVVGRLSYPVSVSKDNEIVNYEDLYTVTYPVGIGKMLNAAKGIVDAEKKNPDYIDLVYLTESNLSVKIYDIDVNKNLYVITDDQSVVDGVQYVFQFANKF